MILRRLLSVALLLCLIAAPACAARYDLPDGRFIVLSLGGVYGCARSADGTITVWGDNQFGQLGRGFFNEEFSLNYPTQLVSKNPNVHLDAVKDILVTSNFSFLWMEDDSIFGVGSNSFLNLTCEEGDYATHVPVNLPEKPAQLSLGFGHVLMLTEGGDVYAWGRGTMGEIGNGKLYNVMKPYKLPIGNIAQVCAGGHFSLALDKDGGLWGWGDNTYRQLSPVFEESIPLPIRIETGDIRIKSVAAGGYTVTALDEDGAVWTWGRNDLQQLGYDTPGLFSSAPHRVELPLPAVSIACYNSVTYAILSDTSLWCWGNNGYGQLGRGLRETPSALPGPCVESGVILADVGSLFAMCVLEDGTVLATGANNHCELGTRDTVGTVTMQPNGMDLIPD